MSAREPKAAPSSQTAVVTVGDGIGKARTSRWARKAPEADEAYDSSAHVYMYVHQSTTFYQLTQTSTLKSDTSTYLHNN